MLLTVPSGRCVTYWTMSPGRMSGVTPAQHAEGAAPFTSSTPPTDVAPAMVLIVTPLRMSSTSSVFASVKPEASIASAEASTAMTTGSAGGSLIGPVGGVVVEPNATAAATFAVRAQRRPAASSTAMTTGSAGGSLIGPVGGVVVE